MARVLLITTLCIALATRAASYDGVRCSTECPVTGSPKLNYAPGHTYVYNQHGESKLRFENVENANTQVEWTSKVELSMLTPCDVAITIKEFQMNGKDSSTVPEMGKVSERPLMMAIVDGRVQHVCVDPEDDTWSVNAKMSVASYVQNTLPSFSEINAETTIIEKDIQGKCPTRYSLTPVSDTDVQVVKEKDNKRCEDRFYHPSETMNNLPWLNMPLPLEESSSTCQQNIQSGIYTSIECTDTNVLKPMYGVYKHIKAIQKATLQFESQVEADPALLTFSSDHLVKKELKFDFTTPKKRENLVPRLDAILTDICAKVEKSIEPEVAALVYQGMTLLRNAPDSYVKTILDNIRAGTYCPDWHKLEQMYLDAIAFLGESGAVPVMVEEVSQGLASPGRTALYATAVHMMPRPNAYAIKSLAPLVTMSNPPKMALLAAGSMVNTYIRQHPHYQEEGHVDEIITLATSSLAELCHAATPEEQEHAKLLLKGLGNVGYFPESVASMIKQCYNDVNVETSTRVTAAQAYRKVPCNLWNPREMLRHYYDYKEETEIRSAAYLNAIRCVDDMEELKRIIDFASSESNIQVRSLVLTHLSNLQETDSPNKDHLRYLLSNAVLPSDYGEDIRKFSRNTELSYFFRTLGLGAEIDSNLVYSRKSVLPRSLNFNVTVDVLGNIMNLAEVGARVEGFNSLIDEVFGPKGYLKSTPWSHIINDITGYGQNIVSKFEHLMQSFRAKRSVEFPAVETFLETNVRSRKQEDKLPHADLYLRLFGHEVSFASLTHDLKNLNIDMIIETLSTYVDQTLTAMSKTHINTARTLPFELEYIIPTMQGIPLHFDLGGAAVLGLDVDSEIDVKNIISSENPQAFIELIPSLALEIDGFVGFKSVLKHGIKMKNNLHISHGGKITIDLKKGEAIAIKWDLPEKWDIISFKSQTYMLKEEIQVLNKNPEDKIIPEGINDLRLVEVNECTDFFENPLGLRFCYNLNLPDPLHSSSMPFGKPLEFSLTAEKAEASMEGYALTATLTNEVDNKAIDLVIDTPGSSTPRESKAKISYTKQDNSYIAFVSVNSALLEYSAQTTFVNDAENKALEMFWKYKLMNMADEYAHAFKTDLLIKTTDTHKKLGLILYYNPSWTFQPESQIFEASWLTATQDSLTNLDITVRTNNALRNLIQIDFEAGVDFHFAPLLPMPIINNIRKWETDVEVLAWKLHEHIRAIEESEDSAQWSIKCSLTKGEHTYVGIETITTKSGTFPNSFNIDMDTTAILGEIDLRSLNKVHYDGTKMEIIWDFENRKTTEQIIHVLASLTRKDAEKFSYESKLQFHIPKLTERLDIVGHIDQVEESKYDVISTFLHNDEVTYEVKGPITLMLNNKKWLQEMELEITGFSQGPHKLTTVLENSNKAKKVVVDVRDSTGILLNSMIDRTLISEEESDIKTSFVFLLLTDTKADFHLSKDTIHINFNSLLFPQESYKQRIKGFIDQDFRSKVFKSDIFWDAESDESKKVSIETNYDFPEGGPLAMHGGVVVMGEPHQYNLKVQLASPLRIFEGHNEVDLVWTTPAQQTFNIQALLDKHTLPYDKSSMTALIHFKTIYDNIYEWKGEYNLEYLQEPMNFQLDSGFTLKSPQIEEIVSVIHAHHKKTEEERDVSFKVDISKSKLTEPILADISVKFAENLYEAKITFDHAGKHSSIESHGTRTSDEESWLKSGKITFEANLPFEVISKFKADSEKNEDGSMHLEIIKNDQSYFNIRISQTEPIVWTVRVETPSRTLEAVSRLDSSQPSVQLWTNKENSDAKFELSGNVLTKEVRGTQGTRIEAKISHPDLSKDIMVSAEYGLSSLTVVGSLELDIFQAHDDMIVLTLQGTKKSEGSYTTEMSVSAKALKFPPTIVLDTTMTTSTKGIELHYRYDPAEPRKTIALKYERIVPEEAILSAKLKTPSIDMEISTSLRSEETTQCHGLNLDTHYVLQSQKYEINSHLCYPAHIEVVAFKKDDDNSKKYYLNAGWKSPTKVELDLHVEKPWENQLHRFADVAGIKAELTSPVTLDLEGHYHHVEVEENMNEIMETITPQLQTFIQWWQSIYHQLQEDAASQNLELPIVEAHKVYLYFYDEFVYIYEDLRKDELIPDFVHIFHVVIDELHSIVTMAHEAYDYANVVIIQIYTGYVDFMSKISKAYQSQIMESLVQIRTVLVQLKELYEKNQLTPETIVQTLRSTSLWEKIEELAGRLQEEYPQEYQAVIDVWNIVNGEYSPVKIMNHIKDLYPEEWEAVTYVVSHVIQDIKTDANNAYRRLMQRPLIRKVIEWFLHSFGFENIPQAEEVLRFLYQLLEETLQLNYFKKEGKLHLVLPLNRPVYSLTTVPYGVSPRLPVWKSFIGLLQTFIPMQYKVFNTFTSSPAIYYGDGSLYTFDGKMLKLPVTPCQYILATDGYDHVTVRVLPENKYEFGITVNNGHHKIVIDSEYKVYFDDQEQTEEKASIYPHATVSQHAGEVIARGESLYFTVSKSSPTFRLYASAELQGRLEGLMGTLNNFQGDDMMMPNGELAPDGPTFLKSWQVDSSC